MNFMKIAIATTKNNLSGSISLQAGRAPYYLIIDEQGELLEAIRNPFAVGGGGAGTAVAKMLADKGVHLVVAAKLGPNMVAGLNERGIKFQEAQGAVEDIIKEVTNN
jgi:predicted Fe-Mo cluster-binding NifX family protein